MSHPDRNSPAWGHWVLKLTEKGFTPRDVAKRAGVPVAQVRRIARDQRIIERAIRRRSQS